MNALHEAIDDIAGEVTPTSPPVGPTMLRGRRMRKRRLTAAIAGSTAALAIVAGGAASIPALTSQGTPTAPAAGQGADVAAVPADTPLVRPVLLKSDPGSATAYGDASRVNAATLKLFRQLTCKPEKNPLAADSSWKATAGYTGTRWNAPGSEVVSCDPFGDKYVLGQAVVAVGQVTSARASQEQNVHAWVVTLTLNGTAKAAVKKLTSSQYKSYYPRSPTDANAAALDSNAFIVNGNVISAPIVQSPLTAGTLVLAGLAPNGFSKAEAKALAARM